MNLKLLNILQMWEELYKDKTDIISSFHLTVSNLKDKNTIFPKLVPSPYILHMVELRR